jgi:hypothetical protein
MAQQSGSNADSAELGHLRSNRCSTMLREDMNDENNMDDCVLGDYRMRDSSDDGADADTTADSAPDSTANTDRHPTASQCSE